jgi:hypothetical protein
MTEMRSKTTHRASFYSHIAMAPAYANSIFILPIKPSNSRKKSGGQEKWDFVAN